MSCIRGTVFVRYRSAYSMELAFEMNDCVYIMCSVWCETGVPKMVA